MKLSFPSSSEIIADEAGLPTRSWFAYFQELWKYLSGGLGISIGGILNINTAAVANSGSGATNLISYDLAANYLIADGDLLEVEAWGIYAANANNKTVALSFGSQTILTTGAVAANSGSWYIKARIIKTAAATQEIIAQIISSNSGIAESATRTAGTQTLTSSNTIKCVGTGGATNDIIEYGMIIKLFPNK